MKRTHPAFWGAGWAGIFVGSLLSLYGTVVPGEVAQLAGGYGLLLTGSALYLIAGLGLKQTLARRAPASRQSVAIGSRATAAPPQS